MTSDRFGIGLFLVWKVSMVKRTCFTLAAHIFHRVAVGAYDPRGTGLILLRAKVSLRTDRPLFYSSLICHDAARLHREDFGRASFSPFSLGSPQPIDLV